MGYMERKGSGFGKIIGGYEFQINYNESKKPSFRSDRYQFTVIMPNLNYSVPQDGTQDGTRDGTQDNNDFARDNMSIQIKNLIKRDNKISTEKMAMVLGSSIRTIKRRIKEMEEVHFVGRGANGHWEITDEEK